jgi:hypothetical protein
MPSEWWHFTIIAARRRKSVSLTIVRGYDFHEPVGYSGNIGQRPGAGHVNFGIFGLMGIYGGSVDSL